MSYMSNILKVKNITLQQKQKQLIGTGIKYPVSPNPFKGNIDYYEYKDAIKKINQSLFIILTTPIGSRINQPDFGSNIYRYVFDPLTKTTAKIVAKEIYDALYKWEKRINIESITYTFPKDSEYHTILFDIAYTLITTQVPGNYVFPFNDSIRPVLG